MIDNDTSLHIDLTILVMNASFAFLQFLLFLVQAVEKDCPGLYSSLGVDGNLSELCESVKDEEIEVDQPEPLPEPLPQAEPLPQPEPVTVPQSTETQTDDATPESTTQSSATKTAFHVVSSLIAIAIFINA